MQCFYKKEIDFISYHREINTMSSNIKFTMHVSEETVQLKI